jgi:hypothetical protein
MASIDPKSRDWLMIPLPDLVFVMSKSLVRNKSLYLISVVALLSCNGLGAVRAYY